LIDVVFLTGRTEVLRVAVDSYDEAHQTDAWAVSSHQVAQMVISWPGIPPELALLALHAAQVFRRMTSITGRALAYFVRREHCWYGMDGSDAWVSGNPRAGTTRAKDPTHARTVPGATAPVAETPAADGGDVIMSDAGVDAMACSHQPPPSAMAVATPSAGGSSRRSMHGAVLESLLLWLSLFRDLFSRPCCVSGKILMIENSQVPQPPLFRQFK
jgi:hypothetical protein